MTTTAAREHGARPALTFIGASTGGLPYWTAGPADPAAPVIVFLHGWGCAPWVYGTVLAELARGARVYAPCLPGLCWVRSGQRLRSHHDLARRVVWFCDAHGIKSARVVGQSTGGGVAAWFCALRPSIPTSLVLLDTTGGGPRSLIGAAFGVLFDVILRRSDPRYALAHIRIIASLLRNLAGGREHMLHAAQFALREDLRPVFSTLTLPVLILWGEHDLLFPQSRARAIQHCIRGSQLRIVRGGEHLWPLCRQREAAAAIAAFGANM